VLKYILFTVFLIAAIFGLVYLAQKFMGKYGHILAEKYGEKTDRKKIFEEINNTCLIIAFLLFVLSLMPELNRTLFFTMSIVFVLRSLRGPISVFRALWVLIGGFVLGVVISLGEVGMLAGEALPVLLIISAVMLFLGFKKSKRRSSGAEHKKT